MGQLLLEPRLKKDAFTPTSGRDIINHVQPLRESISANTKIQQRQTWLPQLKLCRTYHVINPHQSCPWRPRQDKFHCGIYKPTLTILSETTNQPWFIFICWWCCRRSRGSNDRKLLELRKYCTPNLKISQYPFEFAKTRSQLGSNNPSQTSILHLVRNVLRTEGVSGLYTGCSTLVVVSVYTYLSCTYCHI
jgi:hypothetical protein